MKFLSALFLTVTVSRASAECSVSPCLAGNTCFTTPALALNCLENVPFRSDWASATIDTITSSLEAGFGFKALYHDTGPPYSISLDIMRELRSINIESPISQFSFEESVQQTIIKTLDAHTRYSKPKCFNATFAAPFVFELSVARSATPSGAVTEDMVATLAPSTFHANFLAQYPELEDTLASIMGEEVLLLNSKEFVSEVHGWGSSHDARSNNPGARFNAAVRSYLYRSAMSYPIADTAPMDVIKITTLSGVEVEIPWLVIYGPGLGDADACVDSDSDSDSVVDHVHVQHEPAYSVSIAAAERSDRKVVIDLDDAQYHVSCFLQAVEKSDDSADASVSNVLVMKVGSFSPSNAANETDFMIAWEGFVGDIETCLNEHFDMVVLDVMQNGGGYVCLGIRLMEMLVEDFFDDHTKTQMVYDLPHSDLMSTFVDVYNYPDPFVNPMDVEQILNPVTQESYNNGAEWYYPGRNVTMGGVTSLRSNTFCLDCRNSEQLPSTTYRPATFVPPSHLVILTDGTCGSTCASFTKVIQEAEKATFVGAGGLWGEPMDVSSFAGGFVCNPSYLVKIAELAGLAGSFPTFLTNQAWQFGWAVWYSARFPGRPAQFTQQEVSGRSDQRFF